MREDLVATAVNFLQNQKVQSSPLQQRLNFLEKKGLNQEEINEAIKRSKITEFNSVVANYNQNATASIWNKAGHAMSIIIVFGGVAYFVNNIFKKYIAPRLGWGLKSSSIEDSLLAIVNSNQQMLNEITLMVSRLTDLQKQSNDSHAIQSSNLARPEIDGQLLDLKNEIKSVKALLLRKDQFPLPPTVTPVIPSWQLEKKTTIAEVNKNSIADRKSDVIDEISDDETKKSKWSNGESNNGKLNNSQSNDSDLNSIDLIENCVSKISMGKSELNLINGENSTGNLIS